MKFVKAISLALAGLVAAKPINEGTTAVVIDKNIDVSQYSEFFSDAEESLQMVVVDVKDKDFDLFSYGDLAFDNVILFPAQVKCEYQRASVVSGCLPSGGG